MTAKALQVGDRVTVGSTELIGTVKFLGVTEFATGEWLGIELDEQAGKNDGSVKGKRYFESKPEHGIFVRPTAATKVETVQLPSVSVTAVEAAVRVEPPASPSKRLDPPSNRSSRNSGGSLALPGSEKPKRISHGERSLEIQKAGVQLELAQAMEDHDVDSIKRLLPVAGNLGVDPKELASAKRILSFEVQQDLVEEVDTVRSMLTQLAESVAKVEEQAASKFGKDEKDAGVLQRIGPELERRVWAKLMPRLEGILQGLISKVSEASKKATQPAAKTYGFEAYTFEDFDLNGDGYITREEFNEVRKKILSGQLDPAAPDLQAEEAAAGKIQAVYRGRAVREKQALRTARQPQEILPKAEKEDPAAPDLQAEEAAAGKIQAVYRGRAVREKQARKKDLSERGPLDPAAPDLPAEEAAAGKIQAVYRGRAVRKKQATVKSARREPQELPSKADNEALCRALRHSVYSRAATLQKVMSAGPEHYTTVRWCVQTILKRAAVRCAEMLFDSVEQKRAEAYADIESIRASKKRIEEAEKKAEQQLTVATTKVQACARGKLVRQQRQQIEDSTKILQRGFRRLRQRWQQGRKMDFAAVVRAVKGQRKDWTLEYYLACGSEDALNREAFVSAMQKVEIHISRNKVEKLWQGFINQSDEGEMRLPTFWAICEAVAQGDDRAAEFADLSLEEYLEGEEDGQYSEEEVLAAQRIQAAQRGRQQRRQRAAAEVKSPSPAEQAAAERIQAAFHGRMVREQQAAAERIQACYQGRMVREQQAAAERIQACFQGRMVREQVYYTPADWVDPDLQAQEAAAEKIQAIYRGRMVREQQAFRPAARGPMQDSRPRSIEVAFDEALVKQGIEGGTQLLLPSFVEAISKATRASEAQAKAIFNGTCEGTGQNGVALKLFCEIHQAIEKSDAAAAEFADLHLEDYQCL